MSHKHMHPLEKRKRHPVVSSLTKSHRWKNGRIEQENRGSDRQRACTVFSSLSDALQAGDTDHRWDVWLCSLRWIIESHAGGGYTGRSPRAGDHMVAEGPRIVILRNTAFSSSLWTDGTTLLFFFAFHPPVLDYYSVEQFAAWRFCWGSDAGGGLGCGSTRCNERRRLLP